MAYSWNMNRRWAEVTRTERFFVSQLANAISQNFEQFICFLAKETSLHIPESNDWEVSTDVHFFRDRKKYFDAFGWSHGCGQSYDSTEFDLVLFSESLLLVFEAKAWSCYSTSQLCNLKTHRSKIEQLFEKRVKVLLIGIHSSRYSPSGCTTHYFDGCVTWNALSRAYECDLPEHSRHFTRADRTYRNKSDDNKNNLRMGYEVV